ncbi:hypothetical protein M407DRAFT_245792 [Tulasnella calospora MUT 4182]|uniref:Uncharacterized protein n=1 Tax=Tulasnella calospora MUT 4182 TaxID=1051891 RepID=A0A0C3Q8A2_9AGAM|nr:hypothetical protein M407DRAFT_245792 [Tulasnella calospora MUT 4182]
MTVVAKFVSRGEIMNTKTNRLAKQISVLAPPSRLGDPAAGRINRTISNVSSARERLRVRRHHRCF